MTSDRGPGPAPLTYDMELRRLDESLRRAVDVRPGDHVLDIGCGAGGTTLRAARAAWPGRALGVDVSASAIEHARQRAREQGVVNVDFECGDAQSHPFPRRPFDVAISRFGTMFFDDPAAAFAHVGRALRTHGRLVMMVWQAGARNEWDVAIRRALEGPEGGREPFSLADPSRVTGLLEGAGFVDVTFGDVEEPVFYGGDVPTALAWVRGFASTSATLGALDPAAAAQASGRLEEMLAAHLRDDGVWLGARAWIVAARRG